MGAPLGPRYMPVATWTLWDYKTLHPGASKACTLQLLALFVNQSIMFPSPQLQTHDLGGTHGTLWDHGPLWEGSW